MKSHGRRLVMFGLAVLALAGNGAVGWADEGGARSHFAWVLEEEIKPEHMNTYMQARIADAKLSAQHKFEFPFLTFVQDFHVNTCGIFSAFAQFDSFPEKMETWKEKTGGKSEQLEKQALACVSTLSTSIVLFRPDLSYVPNEPAFMPDYSQPFYQSAIVYHLKPDKYEQAEAMAKKIKELNEKRQSPMGYWMYERILGQNAAAFIAVVQAKDKVAFVNLNKKREANHDPDIEKVFADNAHLLTKLETMEGTYIPEASYVPEGTFGTP